MAETIDLGRLQKAVEDANKVARIREKVGQLHKAIDQIIRLREDLTALLEGCDKPTRRAKGKPGGKTSKARKAAHPKPGSGPEQLCRVMGSTPMPVSEIAKKTGLSEGTIRVYLGQFSCFKNVRGKGYTCNHRASGRSTDRGEKGTQKRKTHKTKTRKTRTAKTEATTGASA
ncbi:MAG TPA: hypothetical protein ENN87_02055 [Phycisphaerales bacterium]|nr:hypothetical protein [Phycisphaerales bacterium]